MAKCKDWASDPKMWFALAVIAGVTTAIATAYVSNALKIQNAKLKAQLQSAGIPPEA